MSDGDGGHTWAKAQLSVASVNDAPLIEDVWYGRPIFGYQYTAVSTIDEGGAAHTYNDYVMVIDPSVAKAVLNAGSPLYARHDVVSGTSQEDGSPTYTTIFTPMAPAYSRNGEVRPIAFDPIDAYVQEWDYGDPNDPYRQNGAVVAYDPDGDSGLITFSVAETPQHGHGWANAYTSVNAPAQLDHTQAGPYWIGERGAWQYYSQHGDPFNGADPFTIFATDGSGASTLATISTTHVGTNIGGGGKKPVTLDLDGDGLHYVSLEGSNAYFDINNDGWREHLAWISAGDGLLVRDIGGDRVIDRFDEISFTGYRPGARTDLEGLVAFDSNGDGVLSRLDARWNEFGVWSDANGDGVSQAREFHTMEEIGIVSIELASDHEIRVVEGVTEFGQAKFTWADGHTASVGDIALPVDISTAEHAALLMAQWINAASGAANSPSLAAIHPEVADPTFAIALQVGQWEQATQSQGAQLQGTAA